MLPIGFRSFARRRALARLFQQAKDAQRPIVEGIPTMIWISEQQFLYSLARDYFRGIGVIVDAGVFLGSSTRSFAAGLRARADLARILQGGRPVRSYDLCLCDQFMASLINEHYGTDYKPDDSFREILEKNIAGCMDCTQFVAGDIREHAPGAPIEVLFLDVCKTSDVNAHVIKNFFPRLIPGHSVLIQQDFIHEWLPWIHVTMGLFKPYFKFLGVVGDSPSAVWLNTRQIPDVTPWEREGGSDLYQSAPLPRLVELFERGIAPLTSEKQQYLVDLAKSRMIAERGDKPGAFRLLDRLKLRFDQLHDRPSYYASPSTMRDYIESAVL